MQDFYMDAFNGMYFIYTGREGGGVAIITNKFASPNFDRFQVIGFEWKVATLPGPTK